MGNGAPQTPRTLFPGFEFYALAPGRDIALGPRLSQGATSTLTSIPAATIAAVSVAIQNFLVDMTPRDAVYFAHGWSRVGTGDLSAQLQILSQKFELQNVAGTAAFDIALPVSTLTTPAGIMLTAEVRDLLVPMQDLTDGVSGLGFTLDGKTPLNLVSQVTFKNLDGAAAHSVLVTAWAAVHLIRGVVR